MTATVTAMFAPADPKLLQAGIEDLACLANNGADVLDEVARVLARPADEVLVRDFGAVCEAVRVRDALACGAMAWCERFDASELEGGDSRQGAAIEMAAGIVLDEIERLINGETGT